MIRGSDIYLSTKEASLLFNEINPMVGKAIDMAMNAMDYTTLHKAKDMVPRDVDIKLGMSIKHALGPNAFKDVILHSSVPDAATSGLAMYYTMVTQARAVSPTVIQEAALEFNSIDGLKMSDSAQYALTRYKDWLMKLYDLVILGQIQYNEQGLDIVYASAKRFVGQLHDYETKLDLVNMYKQSTQQESAKEFIATMIDFVQTEVRKHVPVRVATQRNKTKDTGAEGEGGKDIVDTRRIKKDRVNTDWRASKPCHIERDYGYCKRKDCGFKHTKPHGPHIQVNSTIVADNQEAGGEQQGAAHAKWAGNDKSAHGWQVAVGPEKDTNGFTCQRQVGDVVDRRPGVLCRPPNDTVTAVETKEEDVQKHRTMNSYNKTPTYNQHINNKLQLEKQNVPNPAAPAKILNDSGATHYVFTPADCKTMINKREINNTSADTMCGSLGITHEGDVRIGDLDMKKVQVAKGALRSVASVARIIKDGGYTYVESRNWAVYVHPTDWEKSIVLCPEPHGDVNLFTLPIGPGGSRCNILEAHKATMKAEKAIANAKRTSKIITLDNALIRGSDIYLSTKEAFVSG